jgi:DnaK suppressor protein
MQAKTSRGPLAGPDRSRTVPTGGRPIAISSRPIPTGSRPVVTRGSPGSTGSKSVPARSRAVPAGGPRWRALLEARWRARLQEVTELALAYHDAAATAGTGGGHEVGLRLRQLLRRTVASRRALADTEEALARLSAGTYGWCESCPDAIGADRLSAAPEARYCALCAQEPRPDVPAAFTHAP